MNQSMPEGIKPAKCPSELTLLLLFAFPSLLTANTCAARTSGNFNVPNMWTRCGATTPQPGDTISIGPTHVVTLTSNASFESGILTGSTGRPVSDRAPPPLPPPGPVPTGHPGRPGSSVPLPIVNPPGLSVSHLG